MLFSSSCEYLQVLVGYACLILLLFICRNRRNEWNSCRILPINLILISSFLMLFDQYLSKSQRYFWFEGKRTPIRRNSSFFNEYSWYIFTISFHLLCQLFASVQWNGIVIFIFGILFTAFYLEFRIRHANIFGMLELKI